MNPVDNYSWSILKRDEELLKRAAEIQLVNMAYAKEPSKKNGFSKFLAMLEKELESLGFSLELSYGGQPEPQNTLSQPGNLGDCA